MDTAKAIGTRIRRFTFSKKDDAPITPKYPYRLEGHCTLCGDDKVIYDVKDNPYVMKLWGDAKKWTAKFNTETGKVFILQDSLMTAHNDSQKLLRNLEELNDKCDDLLDDLNNESEIPKSVKANLLRQVYEIRRMVCADKVVLPGRMAKMAAVWEDTGLSDDEGEDDAIKVISEKCLELCIQNTPHSTPKATPKKSSKNSRIDYLIKNTEATGNSSLAKRGPVSVKSVATPVATPIATPIATPASLVAFRRRGQLLGKRDNAVFSSDDEDSSDEDDKKRGSVCELKPNDLAQFFAGRRVDVESEMFDNIADDTRIQNNAEKKDTPVSAPTPVFTHDAVDPFKNDESKSSEGINNTAPSATTRTRSLSDVPLKSVDNPHYLPMVDQAAQKDAAEGWSHPFQNHHANSFANRMLKRNQSMKERRMPGSNEANNDNCFSFRDTLTGTLVHLPREPAKVAAKVNGTTNSIDQGANRLKRPSLRIDTSCANDSNDFRSIVYPGLQGCSQSSKTFPLEHRVIANSAKGNAVGDGVVKGRQKQGLFVCNP